MYEIVYSTPEDRRPALYRLVRQDPSHELEVWRGTLDQIPEVYPVEALASVGDAYRFELYEGNERNWALCSDPRAKKEDAAA